ncbi:hypothetical protein ACQKCF_07815 [Psychrobacter proteolyticus]|uniref:hypothetical protein n=1 Tax=Psychrobacter proteolyticus TaxID=147825 RepID=UPI003D00E34E
MMTTRDDGLLDSDYIKSKIKGLSPRLLYVLMTEVSIDKSQSTSVVDVDYLSRRLAELNIMSEDLDSYIDIAHNHVLDDKAVDWIFKSLRVVLWFDDYLKKNRFKALTPYILKFQPILRTTYIDDCLKIFDTCYLLTEEESNNIYNNRSMNDGRYVRVMKPRNVATNIYDMSISLPPRPSRPSRPIRENYDTSSTSNRRNSTLRLNKHIKQFERKSEFINCAKVEYSLRRTSEKYTDWLDVKNEQQILWAQEHLYSQNLLIQPRGFLTDTLQSIYEQVCASLDIIDTGLDNNSTTYGTSGMSLKKKEIIRKMRGAWSQKKFRDKKDAESALEYILNRRHINKLKKLASDYGVSSTEYLQQLIDDAYDKT